MSINVTAIEDAVRAWVRDAVAPDIPDARVIHAHQSRPAAVPKPFALVHVGAAMTSPQWDDVRGMEVLPITGIVQGARTFQVAGNKTASLPALGKIVVADSTASVNDAQYDIESSTYVSGPNRTDTVVVQAIPGGAPAAFGVLTGMRPVVGPRRLMVQVDVVGPNALGLADRCKTALHLGAVQANLRAAGLAINTASEVRDLTALFDTDREPRAQFDVGMSVQSRVSEFTSIIERVTHRTLVSDIDGSAAFDSTLTTDVDSP